MVSKASFTGVNANNFDQIHSISKKSYLSKARNGFRYNCKSHLGNLKQDLRTLLEHQETYDKAKEKIDNLQDELFDLVDEAWISKRNEVLDDD